MRNLYGILSIFISFAVFCPESRQAEASVKKQEEGKNNFDFLSQILKPLTDKHINSQDEIKEDYKPGEIFGEFLHNGYR